MWSQEVLFGTRRLLCRARRPSSVEPGGPMWSPETLCGARRPSVEPGGPLWSQEALLCGARRPSSVEPGDSPL